MNTTTTEDCNCPTTASQGAVQKTHNIIADLAEDEIQVPPTAGDCPPEFWRVGCDKIRRGTALCDIRRFVAWAKKGNAITLNGTASNGVGSVWRLSDDGLSVGHVYLTPVQGEYTIDNTTILLNGFPVAGVTVGVLPIEVAKNPDGIGAGTLIDVYGRGHALSTSVTEVKDGRCGCKPIRTGCVYPVVSNQEKGGFLFQLDFPFPLLPTDIVSFTGHITLTNRDCVCPVIDLPCERGLRQDCHPQSDLLALSKVKTTKAWCGGAPGGAGAGGDGGVLPLLKKRLDVTQNEEDRKRLIERMAEHLKMSPNDLVLHLQAKPDLEQQTEDEA